jgi:hypothetical protein
VAERAGIDRVGEGFLAAGLDAGTDEVPHIFIVARAERLSSRILPCDTPIVTHEQP